MKTTIDLPDALVADMKELVAAENTTMRELVVDGLRREIDRRTATRPRADFVFATVDGEGLAAEIDPASLTRLAYDLP